MSQNNDISIEEFKLMRNRGEKNKPMVARVVTIIAFVVLAILILSFCIFEKGKLSEFGTFIGGTLGTFAAIVSVYFVYMIYVRQQIESHFIEVLKLHQEDVDLIYKKEGVKAFAGHISIVHAYSQKIKNLLAVDNDTLEYKRDILQIAYLCSFYGTSDVEKSEESIINGFTQVSGIDIEIKNIIKQLHNNGFRYEGAYHTLSIYFRQLYQAVKYIDEHDINVLKVSKKYEYVKMLRVRLSVDEQYLLFLNSLVKVGEVWDDQHEALISKYNMLTNIPPIYPFILNLNVNEIYDKVEYENESMNKTTTEKSKNEASSTEWEFRVFGIIFLSFKKWCRKE